MMIEKGVQGQTKFDKNSTQMTNLARIMEGGGSTIVAQQSEKEKITGEMR